MIFEDERVRILQGKFIQKWVVVEWWRHKNIQAAYN